MKKALVILMALAMVFAVYADDLAAVTIKGSATLGYEIDLDASAYGMTNASDPSQEYTVTIVTADLTNSTSGSGVWGELSEAYTFDTVDYFFEDEPAAR